MPNIEQEIDERDFLNKINQSISIVHHEFYKKEHGKENTLNDSLVTTLVSISDWMQYLNMSTFRSLQGKTKRVCGKLGLTGMENE